MAKLTGNPQGHDRKFADQLRNSQERATKEGFDHVNKTWYKQCMQYDVMEEILEQSASKTHDAVVHLGQIKAEIDGDRPSITVVGGKHDGQKYSLSETSSLQFSQLIGLSGSVLSAAQDETERQYIEKLMQHRLQTVVGEKDKELFLRFRDGAVPSIRAFLTRRYCVIDHRWVLEQMKKFIPGGIVSHFDPTRFYQNEGDYCRYNVLIPDTIREEKDSDYGGGLNVGNSEIGTGRYSVRPMIFRHICFNGNIWNCEKGKAIQQVHKGQLDLNFLSVQTMVCIHSHIPLLSTNLESLLRLQGEQFKTDTNMLKLIAQLKNIKDVNLTYPQIAAILAAYSEEANLGNTAFSFINAITRAAHMENVFTLEQQDMLETLAGSFAQSWLEKPERFVTYCKNAEEVNIDKILKALAA